MGFTAVSQANTRYSKGYVVTGIGSIVCARHGFILPNSTGDLQKGERYVCNVITMLYETKLYPRYCNMDYLVLSMMKAYGELPPTILSPLSGSAHRSPPLLPSRSLRSDSPSVVPLKVRARSLLGSNIRWVYARSTVDKR